MLDVKSLSWLKINAIYVGLTDLTDQQNLKDHQDSWNQQDLRDQQYIGDHQDLRDQQDFRDQQYLRDQQHLWI